MAMPMQYTRQLGFRHPLPGTFDGRQVHGGGNIDRFLDLRDLFRRFDGPLRYDRPDQADGCMFFTAAGGNAQPAR